MSQKVVRFLLERYWLSVHISQLQIPYNAENPLIRRIKTYEKITSYMGEEIGNLFLERNLL